MRLQYIPQQTSNQCPSLSVTLYGTIKICDCAIVSWLTTAKNESFYPSFICKPQLCQPAWDTKIVQAWNIAIRKQKKAGTVFYQPWGSSSLQHSTKWGTGGKKGIDILCWGWTSWRSPGGNGSVPTWNTILRNFSFVAPIKLHILWSTHTFISEEKSSVFNSPVWSWDDVWFRESNNHLLRNIYHFKKGRLGLSKEWMGSLPQTRDFRETTKKIPFLTAQFIC